MSDAPEVFTSRRERREAEKGLSPKVHSEENAPAEKPENVYETQTYSPPPSISPTISTTGSDIQQTTPESYKRQDQSAARVNESYLEPASPLSFESATNLGTEPISASIVINHVPDLENNVMIIPETGDFLRTGSIELPKLDTSTGGVSMILEGQAADEAIVEDSLNSFVSSVAPLRATGLAKSRSRNVEVALTSRSGQGHIYAVMSTAVLMITVGALVVAAYLLGIFN
jgi:hypothetical protein